MATTTIAAFDFDATLTRRDSVVPFLRRFTSIVRFGLALVRYTFSVVPAAARRDRDQLRAVATEITFRGRSISEVESEAMSFGRDLVADGMRPDTLARLRWHLDQGHRIVIVSASYELYLHVVAAEIGPIDVLGTKLDVSDGLCTGRLAGANCRGPEKVRRLESWLLAVGLERDRVVVYAYGDSSGDREMLAWADHPHWVEQPLASVAPTV